MNKLKIILTSIFVFLFSFSITYAAINIVPNGGTGVGTITGIIQGNGTSPFSAITVGSGLTFSGGTLSATGGSGTVTSVTVTGANGIGVTGSPITTNGTIALSLGAITPTTVNGVTISGSSTPTLAITGTAAVSGTNTGDQTTSGTTNRISVATGTTNPVIDISGSYVGQTSITTLGTIGTGTWAGTTIAVNHGGTGQTAYTDGQLLIGNTATGGLSKATITAGSGISVTNGNGTISIAATGGGGTVTSVASADGSVTVTNPTTTVDLAVVKAPIWTTARNLAGNSVDGSTNVAFANKFVVQGTTDAGLSSAQFLGALGTGIVKNTTTTGVLSIAVAGDFPTLNQSTTGSAATLTTARAIWGQNFDGSGAISGSLTGVGNITGGASSMTITAGTGNSRTLALQSTTSGGTATTFLTGNADQSTTLAGNLSGTGAFNIIGGAGNMTITAGTGNSRTMALQTTTSGGTATTFLTGNADQSATFAGAISNGTSGVITTGTIELGAVSDTTLSRVSAGKIAVEGVNVVTTSSTDTLTNKTITNSNNVLGGVTMTLGSDAANDIYYRNSSGILTRLANGTTGQYLAATTSNPPSWASVAATMTVGTSVITSGTTTRILYDNAGVLGEYTLTGTGTVVAMQAAPTFTTSITDPLVIGGTGTTSPLTLQSTSGIGAAGADLIFKTGNNGATEDMRILNNGDVGIGTATPNFGGYSGHTLTIVGGSTSIPVFEGIRQITTGGSTLFLFRGGDTTNPAAASLEISSGSGSNAADGQIDLKTSNAGASVATGLTINSTQHVGIDGATIGAFLTLPAGTATTGNAPLSLISGTLNTTAQPGAEEYDGNVFYTTPVTGARGVSPSEMYSIVPAADFSLATAAGVQAAFPTTADVWTLAASTTYQFQGQYIVTKATTSTVTDMAFGLAGGASITSINYNTTCLNANVNTAGTAGQFSYNNAVSAEIVCTTSAGNIFITFQGIIRMNAGGTVTPQIDFVSGSTTPVMKANSYITFTPLGTNTQNSVGNVN